jgi:hypothetical protein
MSAARSLPEPLPSGHAGADSSGAANDGPTALALGPSAFDETPLGETPSTTETSALAMPPAHASGPTEHGAEICGRLVARAQNGSLYPGDLWRDILQYRELRMRTFAPVLALEGGDARLAELESRLRADDRGGARQFTRFACRRTATLSFHSRVPPSVVGSRLDVLIVDVSAGGARLEPVSQDSGDERSLLVEGAEVALHVEGAGGPADTVLPSRIVWMRGGAFGIMFAGAPRVAR